MLDRLITCRGYIIMASPATRAHTHWRGIVVVALLVAGECVASAQSLPPVQRTPEEEKQFRNWQNRYFEAQAVLNACMRKEVERDYGMTFVSVPTTVTHAVNTCSALLERYALADAVRSLWVARN